MGHILSDEGLKTDPSKTSAIRNIETPKNIKQLKTFLGMVNYLS